MPKINIKNIKEKIESLERDRIGYLEADDKNGAKRKAKQIAELEKEIELDNLKDIEKELIIYKKFIKRKMLQQEFEMFWICELAKD